MAEPCACIHAHACMHACTHACACTYACMQVQVASPMLTMGVIKEDPCDTSAADGLVRRHHKVDVPYMRPSPSPSPSTIHHHHHRHPVTPSPRLSPRSPHHNHHHHPHHHHRHPVTPSLTPITPSPSPSPSPSPNHCKVPALQSGVGGSFDMLPGSMCEGVEGGGPHGRRRLTHEAPRDQSMEVCTCMHTCTYVHACMHVQPDALTSELPRAIIRGRSLGPACMHVLTYLGACMSSCTHTGVCQPL